MESGEKSFGKYLLLSKIAAGGMAVTYRARMAAAAGVTKDVVIKKIHPHLAEENDFVEMFIGEAKLTASLTHSNIAQVYDFGELKGEYFLAMEYVQGQALSRVLRRAADRDLPFLPDAVALQIAIKMCDGLHYAHTRKDDQGRMLGLVHRDVSPENTLISYEGEVKIIDFGIAKATQGGKHTETGLVKGKFPYFSPEQATAQRDLDARTDVYAVGVVLFEMMCGRRPYEGEFVHVLAQITSGAIPKPSSINPGISSALEQVMMKALATNRDDRYPTARDFGLALSTLLHARYPGSTSADLALLLGTLFETELKAEGLEVPVPPEFRTALEKTRVPGYGEQRRAQLGLKPEMPKATPRTPARPSSVSNPATPIAGAGSASKSGKVGTGSQTALKPSASGYLRAVRPGATSASGGQKQVKSPSDPSIERGGAGPGLQGAIPTRIPNKTQMRPVDDGMTGFVPGGAGAGPNGASATPDPTPPDALGPRASPEITIPPRGPVMNQRAPVSPLSLDTPELAKKRQKIVISVATPIIVISLIMFVVYFIVVDKRGPPVENPQQRQAYLWLATNPTGAAVTLDGVDMGTTPIDRTITEGAHTIAIKLDGYVPWTNRHSFKSSERYHETVKLEPETPVAVQEPVKTPEPKDTGKKNNLDDKYDAQWPVRLFVIRPRENAVPLSDETTATFPDMKPGTAYQVWTEGGYELGKRRSNRVFYFIEGPNVPQKARFGELGSNATTIKGATKLHVFALDDHPETASGTMKITFRISQYVAPSAITFDASKHTIAPTDHQRFRLFGLKPSSEYLLTLRPDEPRIDESKVGTVTELFCETRNEETESQTYRFFEVGKRIKVTGSTEMRCLFPDVEPGDNSGAIEVDAVDMADLSAEDLAKLGEKRPSKR